MTRLNLSRRRALGLGAALLTTAALPLRAKARPAIHVAKDPDCGCCGAWIEILRDEGFDVTVELMTYDALQAYKVQNGIPESMVSCHTGRIDGYVIEGHVPAADIRRLLEERPDAVGLAVPGMPVGSPGMGPEEQREAYAVHLILKDGTTRVFASYDAA